MPDHQFAKSLPENALRALRVIALWLIPKEAPLKPITTLEKQLASELTPVRSRQFIHSRGYARAALSDLFHAPALDIPLKALPGQPPLLANGWGHVSFSHCQDSFLIGWSPWPIGVDLERSDRAFRAAELAARHFCKAELSTILNLTGESLRSCVLLHWLMKEAAIKWQRGKLGMDLHNWHYDVNSSIIKNKVLGYKLTSHELCHQKWRIAVVSDSSSSGIIAPMLCLS